MHMSVTFRQAVLVYWQSFTQFSSMSYMSAIHAGEAGIVFYAAYASVCNCVYVCLSAKNEKLPIGTW